MHSNTFLRNELRYIFDECQRKYEKLLVVNKFHIG